MLSALKIQTRGIVGSSENLKISILKCLSSILCYLHSWTVNCGPGVLSLSREFMIISIGHMNEISTDIYFFLLDSG